MFCGIRGYTRHFLIISKTPLTRKVPNKQPMRAQRKITSMMPLQMMNINTYLITNVLPIHKNVNTTLLGHHIFSYLEQLKSFIRTTPNFNLIIFRKLKPSYFSENNIHLYDDCLCVVNKL